MITGHLRLLFKKHPALEYVYLFMEANLAWYSVQQMAEVIKEMLPEYQHMIEVVCRDPKKYGRLGVHTGPNEKETYTHRLSELLMDGNILLAKDIVNCNGKVDLANCQKELYEQLKNFRKIYTQRGTNKETSVLSVTWSGKGGSTRKDDLILALQMSNWWMYITREEQAYKNKANARGWLEQ
jgi:hypothetical protein